MVEKSKLNIYVASSWKNPYYNEYLKSISEWSIFNVYNFRNANSAFSFKDLPEWDNSFLSYMACRFNKKFQKAYNNDFDALEKADIVILLLPCGRSAHLELGYAVGRDKTTVLVNPIENKYEFDLMHNMVDYFCGSIKDLKFALYHIVKSEG